jgi:hypothetical protein
LTGTLGIEKEKKKKQEEERNTTFHQTLTVCF